MSLVQRAPRRSALRANTDSALLGGASTTNMKISPFWMAAARLSGRLDFSGCIAAGLDPESASTAQLVQHGVAPALVPRLRCREWPTDSTTALPLTHPDYPAALRPLPFAPPVLFVRGPLGLLSDPGVAIVGARRCSGAARQWARELADAVAGAGGVVVSGLAWGVDEAAHQGAAGRTIAVVAQGLGVPFSGSLARRAAELVRLGGLIVSEFPSDRRPARHLFLQRNRVISGLGRATVVVEAGARSGSLVTARCALDQGRDLFVVPDHPSRPGAAGGLSLLASGVAPLLGADALLDAVGLKRASTPVRSELLELVAQHGTPANLAAHTGQSIRIWNRRLATLELSGQVERLPGGRFAPCLPASR